VYCPTMKVLESPAAAKDDEATAVEV
jgi:hypothetical protein